MSPIDTEALSEKYRSAAVRPGERSLLITDFRGTTQQEDLALPPNCDGLGRIRHFQRTRSARWPENPLPIEPAAAALGARAGAELCAQVFQNAVCNWRCWYCYVPFGLLSADPKHSSWKTADELVELYGAEEKPSPMLDLSGGQPDLVPEWVPWTMDALESRGMDSSVYLWSDDNLSNDYFWRYLSREEQERVAAYPMYGRVCCFKGIDAGSFAFNTAAHEDLFERQFELFARLLNLGIDLYAYLTLTVPTRERMRSRIAGFVDRLQEIDENLPLRTVPLEVQLFTPVRQRLKEPQKAALELQYEAVGCWRETVAHRFSDSLQEMPIHHVPMGRRSVDSRSVS